VKASNVPLMIDAYRLLAGTTDHPLHLGVTEAGPPPQGLIKSVAGIGTLLAEGIGDTIRFSLTADPVEEAKAGRVLLESPGLRERKGLDLIACPSCGRAEVDVIKVARDAMATLETRNIPLQVAVMGCVVNGPGESKHANIGISLPGTGEQPAAPVFVDGVKTVTLRGDTIAEDFHALVEDYVQRTYGHAVERAPAEEPAAAGTSS
jgi:1-hydroxy-2-methyl-2-(E)-butenyl 4-diphosphate synthase